jgi:hypothetical protein
MGCGELDRIIPTWGVVGWVVGSHSASSVFPLRQRKERLPSLSRRHLAARTRRPARAGRSCRFECRPGYRAGGRDCAQHGLVCLGTSSLYLCRSKETYRGDAPRRCRIALLTRSGTLASSPAGTMVLMAHEKGFRQAAWGLRTSPANGAPVGVGIGQPR